MKVLSIFGTRPEAIKMAPLVKALEQHPEIRSVVCVTGQHRSMLQQVMGLFGIRADYELDVMEPNQSLNGLASRLLTELDPVLAMVRPDRVLVHGDTTTAMAAATAAFHRRIHVAHVEAGLRTYDFYQPFPEEMNRRAIDLVSDMMFAPTIGSKQNLLKEHLSGRVFVTGNTVIDALRIVSERIEADVDLRRSLDQKLPAPDPSRKLLLVTGHRRENFGTGFANICEALAVLSQRQDIQIVYPVHLNPNVQGPVRAKLSALPNVHLIEPLDYLHFVRLMQRAHVILTDSGGVQEEAPSLGKPVLVMRDVTERPEAVTAGTVKLVGTEVQSITEAVSALFDSPAAWREFALRINPYGDGYTAGRIVNALLGRPFTEFGADEFTASEVAALRAQ